MSRSFSPMVEPPSIQQTPQRTDDPRSATVGPARPSAFVDFLIDVLQPRRAATRATRSPLLRAWFIHLVGAILALAAVLLVDGFLSTARTTAFDKSNHYIWVAVGHAVETLADFFTLFSNRPIPVGFTVAGIFVGIEILFALVSFIFAAWGALDEPLRHTYRNSLRHTWLRTPSAALAIAAVGLVGTSLARFEARWNKNNPPIAAWPVFPPIPAMPENDPAYAQALADYQAEMVKYNAEVRRIQPMQQAHYESRPWLIHADGPLIGLTGFIGALWFVGGLLRGIGSRRDAARMDRPPMCEACGYNLTTLPLDVRCPECGATVVSSLGPEVRAGVPWEFRSSTGRMTAWRRTTAEALRRPSAFGRRLRVSTANRDHRRFFFVHLPAIFILGGAGLLGNIAAMAGVDDIRRDLPMSILISCIFGCACILGTIVVTVVVAATVGLWYGPRHGRNLLPASMQAACYLAPYLVLWEIFGAASACGAIALGNDIWYHGLQELSGIPREILAVWTWLLPNATCGLLFMRSVSRITYTARFANR